MLITPKFKMGTVLCDVFTFYLVAFSGVTGWGDRRCIILEVDTGHDLATTRFSKPKMVPNSLVCQSEGRQLP